jgi:hypothetical protein
MATVTSPVAVQGRWGWHPCDYATFCEIKGYHRLCLRDYAATKRHQRWGAKDPHNRVRSVPGTASVAGSLARTYQRVPVPEPFCVGTDRETYLWVLATYRAARRPAAAAEAVVPQDLPSRWRVQAEQLRVAYATA